jgi:hypothetical protein
MLKLKKLNSEPRGGWLYYTDEGFEIKSGTFDKLVRDTEKHLKVNDKEIPDNLADLIQHQICLRCPESMCTGDGPKRFFPSAVTVTNGTRALIRLWLSGSSGYVDQETAEKRARDCVVCPYNIRSGGCFFCSSLYKTVKKTLNRSTKYDKHLFICSVCGCLNAAQIHVGKSVLSKTVTKKSLEDYPATGCWKRTLLENEDGDIQLD